MAKIRLDVLLTQRGLANSREKARALIMAGNVFINGQREDKPGSSFAEDKIENIEIKGETLPFVSRGGLKLDKAVKVFELSFDGYTCLDIGASTGGFTDCMLQNGAAKVYSVDVGHGQLDWKLRSDERVVCMEKTNFRYLTKEDITEDIDFASCDVSFISLTKILIPACRLLRDHGRMVVLIKPQFEAGRDKVGKKGVVRDRKVHEEVVSMIVDFTPIAGFDILGLSYSPIRGPEGNIEYLLYLEKKEGASASLPDEAQALLMLRNLRDNKEGISTHADMTKLISDTIGAAHEEFGE